MNTESRQYQPGTVAVATVRGVPNVRVMRDNDGDWLSQKALDWQCAHADRHVTDVRPLVVLDIGALVDCVEDVALVPDWLRHCAHADGDFPRAHAVRRIADQIEAQTKPPRIPEPGLWGVVEAGAGRIPVRRWVHHEEGWWVADTGDRLCWEDLDDPVTLVRDGIEDGAA